ncbi:MAG: SIMPL domain-containing protein [Treponema sp.]|nr:SIMPL domain-containing protein [Treponema sp.]
MKKNYFIYVTIITAVFLLSSCTVKQEAAKPLRTITVSGQGSIFVENDTAKIIFSIVTRNYDINKAVSDNAAKSTQVNEALSKAGLLKSDIATSNYSVQQDANPSPTRVNYGAYTVSNSIIVTVRDISRTGEIIDLCVKNGANQFSSLGFYASQTEKAKKEAEVLAIKNAESKAKSLAAASAAKLGKVQTIKTEYIYSEYLAAQADMKTAEAYTPGKSATHAEVTVTYELE